MSTSNQLRLERAFTVLTSALILVLVGTLLTWMWTDLPGGVLWRVAATAVIAYLPLALGASMLWAPPTRGQR